MGFIAWYSRKRRDTVAGAGVYQWIAFLASLLSIFQGLSMIGFSSEWARFWYDMRIVCFAVIPVLWLVFVLYFVGKSEWISKVRIAVLFIIPVVTQVMLWTNDMHGLWVIHNVSFRSAGPFFIPVLESRVPGPWFVVHNIYTYGMMMVGFVILFVLSVRLQSLYRGQVVALGTGTLIMMIGALVPTLNLFPGMELNPLPQCFAIGSLVIAWGLYRHQFLVASPKYDDDKRIPGVIVMLFVIVTVGILSVGFLYYRQHQNQFRAEVGRTLSSIAELKVSELVQWRKERLADADSLHGNIAFANLMRRIISNPADGDAYRQMRTWLEKIRASYRYDHVVLLDVRGTARLSVPQSVEPLCANVRQQTAEIMRTGRITFLDFHQEAPGKPIHLAVVVPIVEQGHPMGLVALFIDPTAYLFPLLNRWPTPSRTAETLLVRRDGNDVLFLNELRFRKNTALSLRIPLVDERVPAVMAALGREGVVEGIDYRGVPVAAAIRAVPGSPWVMVARMDLAEVYAPLREWLWLMIVLVCAILAGAGSGVWLIWRRQSDRALKEKVETAELLRASENRYRRLFESAKDGILILDVVTGMIVDVNPYMIEMLGFSQEQFREKTIWDIGFLGDIIPNKEKFRELQEKGYVRYEGLPLETSDGRRIDVEFISNVYEIARGKVIQCNIRDISERIRMQRALLGVTSHQEALLSAIPDIVMEVDVNKVYTWSNGPGFEFFGDDVIGREAAYYFEGEQDTYRSVQPLFNGAEETIYLESWQRRRDGERRLLAWWCRVLKDEFGKVTGALSSARDVTESRQAEEAIRESEDKFRGIFDGSTVG
ncbi:MAG TPA: histidine kinase N-terminal 7TM domain-containing protein, partial [Spirochaetota bacterium]|nr:histidine kinase N-terminal 7TM domain-containing protein [Spirochaetota bacterium]